MRTLLALSGVALVVLAAGCGLDPTKKHDYSCTANFGAGPAATSACSQFHITEVEGNATDVVCTNKGGTWAYHACDPTNQLPGYCLVPSAADYSLSGTPAKVYFYSPLPLLAAQDACSSLASSQNTSWVSN
jgi:hypothetical protein